MVYFSTIPQYKFTNEKFNDDDNYTKLRYILDKLEDPKLIIELTVCESFRSVSNLLVYLTNI